MKIKKTVTDAVLAANKANAKQSPGPTTEQGKSFASQNASKHGILAKKVVLHGDEETVEYEAIRKSWLEHFQPCGAVEEYFVNDIVVLLWNLGIVEALEAKELSRRQRASGRVDGLFENCPALPIDPDDLPLDRSWDCEKLLVRVSSTRPSKSSGSREPGGSEFAGMWDALEKSEDRDGRHLEVEAVLGSSLDTLSRYKVRLRKDLYKAIETLRALQKERRERNSTKST